MIRTRKIGVLVSQREQMRSTVDVFAVSVESIQTKE
jgi:hypothetical protein